MFKQRKRRYQPLLQRVFFQMGWPFSPSFWFIFSLFQKNNRIQYIGRSGGLVVSVPILYSSDLSFNPAEVQNYNTKLYLKRTKTNNKRPEFGTLNNITISSKQYNVLNKFIRARIQTHDLLNMSLLKYQVDQGSRRPN